MNDYERIAKAIQYVANGVTDQPTLHEMAAHVHLSPHHFHKLFSRWAGVTPKRFLQVLTVERAKRLLRSAKPLLEVSAAVGLSSGSRLYDHFVTLEAITPGEYKLRGAGLRIEYAVHDTPFGSAFVGMTERGVCKLSFLGPNGMEGELRDLAQRWPRAQFIHSNQATATLMKQMFDADGTTDRPLSLLVQGSNFQVNVWKALLRIPAGAVTSYSEVAAAIDRPAAARAVGHAVGQNPIALLIPCHRVIRQSGSIGGYRWGENRKHAIHAWETARCDEPVSQ